MGEKGVGVLTRHRRRLPVLFGLLLAAGALLLGPPLLDPAAADPGGTGDPGEDAARDDPVVVMPAGEAGPQSIRAAAGARRVRPPAPEPNPEPRLFAGAARITIPAAGVHAEVVGGTTAEHLAQGPGFYPEGSLPHLGGNVAIAGHRTTYGAWFRHLDRLEAGDPIFLLYDGSLYRYEVERVWVIAYNDWSVIAQTGEHVLTLTTCHPPGSSAYRLAVRARWVETIDLNARAPL